LRSMSARIASQSSNRSLVLAMLSSLRTLAMRSSCTMCAGGSVRYVGAKK
jgi:hypothetical protein